MNIDLGQMKLELRRDEGVKDRPYKDSLGNWTIGVGHLLNYTFDPDMVWGDSTIDSVLGEDIQRAYDRLQHAGLLAAFLACDTDPRRRSLVNMSFNLGDHLYEFKTSLTLIASKQWVAAAIHLRDSLWYSQVGKRAERICAVLENGK